MKKTFKTLYIIIAAGITSTAVFAGMHRMTSAESIPPQKQINTVSDNLNYMCKLPMNTDVSKADTAAAKTDNNKTDNNKSAPSAQVLKRMFIYKGRLYVDTNETSTTIPRCGEMDGKIKKTVPADQKPDKELQSNFGRYSFQYGTRKNRMDVLIDGTWHVFAYNENNLNGVSMNVTKNSAHSAKLKITNSTNKKIMFSDDYLLEKRNKKTGEWHRVPYLIDNVGFDDIGYTVSKDNPQTWTANWKFCHGTLKPGTYRIAKSFLAFKSTGSYTEYTLTAKFKVSG